MFCDMAFFPIKRLKISPTSIFAAILRVSLAYVITLKRDIIIRVVQNDQKSYFNNRCISCNCTVCNKSMDF